MKHSCSCVQIESTIKISARYWVNVHSGHALGDAGVRLCTGKGRNKIVASGLNQMGNSSTPALTLCAIVGAGTTAVTMEDTTLESFLGYTNNLISAVATSQDSPDADGYVYHKMLYRFSFTPGDLGNGLVNIGEAGMVVSTNTPNSSTQIFSRGLLVDDRGNPTTVSFNSALEYLDLYWEVTWYVKANDTQTISLNLDGVPTDFNVTIRPCDFLGSDTIKWWPMRFTSYGESKYFPSLGRAFITFLGTDKLASSRALVGPIGTLVDTPSGDYYDAAAIPTLSYSPPYIDGNFFNDITVAWDPPSGNIEGGIGALALGISSSNTDNVIWGFQVGINPSIPKTRAKQLTLVFRIAIANK